VEIIVHEQKYWNDNGITLYSVMMSTFNSNFPHHFQEIDSVIQLHLQFSRFKNHHDITEILLKVALNTIKQTKKPNKNLNHLDMDRLLETM
jgi:imidazoleglycerol phosphate dehydratase HisB